ncbi:hypothetical protein M3484_03605 [Pseudomonas sp. GX19020]|uniref:hypothetical protein n=1 Tax=Pseudomonas sp. GX19020 TaxID=2942277 RepID=UPI00201960A4|nr:hypothetical protein [Pseudomonas sp. GX19020]MCL4065655.1 hypothetical protein [Pseudomonas sp. GX19020]
MFRSSFSPAAFMKFSTALRRGFFQRRNLIDRQEAEAAPICDSLRSFPSGISVYAVTTQGRFPALDQVIPDLVGLLPCDRLTVGMKRECYNLARFHIPEPAPNALSQVEGVRSHVNRHAPRIAGETAPTRRPCEQNVSHTQAKTAIFPFKINNLIRKNWRAPPGEDDNYVYSIAL